MLKRLQVAAVPAFFVLAMTPVLAQNAMVFMKTTPPGAQVFVDGAEKPGGKTPCVVDVKVGEHKVRFELDGHYPEERTFTAKATGGVSVDVKLTKRPTLISIETTPSGAAVFVDGESKGRSPLKGKPVDAGEHEIRIELEGHVTVTETHTFDDGEHKTLKHTLQKGAGAPDAPAEQKQPAQDAADATEPRETPKETASDEKPKAPPKTIEVNCWVCEGSGTLRTMGCPNCSGTGIQGINQCAACNGTGRTDAVCTACKGAGGMMYGGRQLQCRACGGKGAPPCPLCRATGKLTKPNPEASSVPTQTCPACSGTGREMRVKCRICSGAGTRRYYSGGWALTTTCNYCKGAKEAPPHCTRCQGSGVTGSGEHAGPCPQCAGTGQAGTPCGFCRGAGWVPAPR